MLKVCCLIPCCAIFLGVIGLIIALVYLNVGVYQPSDKAIQLLSSIRKGDSNQPVQFLEHDNSLIFWPKGNTSVVERGIVLLPEYKSDVRAYVPLAVDIAKEGYVAALVNSPLNFPPFALGRVYQLMGLMPARNVIGGHGLGGNTASAFATVSNSVQGIFLMAAFPTKDVEPPKIPTTYVYGTNDGYVPIKEVLKEETKYPSTAMFVSIDGGNHGQFGSFDEAFSNDLKANITEADQRKRTATLAINLLQSLSSTSNNSTSPNNTSSNSTSPNNTSTPNNFTGTNGSN